MAEHKHGSMDTKVQRKHSTYISWTVKISLLSIGILVFMVINNAYKRLDAFCAAGVRTGAEWMYKRNRTLH